MSGADFLAADTSALSYLSSCGLSWSGLYLSLLLILWMCGVWAAGPALCLQARLAQEKARADAASAESGRLREELSTSHGQLESLVRMFSQSATMYALVGWLMRLLARIVSSLCVPTT